MHADPDITPPPVIICSHTKKPCEHVSRLYAAVSKIRETINRSVLLGAMIGAGIGSAAKDLLSSLF